MIDPVRAFLEASGLRGSLFPPSSRYHGLEAAPWTDANGQEVVYLRRRIVPQIDRFTTLHEHAVVEGDRIENLAHRHLGDAEQFWRVADANGALRPGDLTETPGVRIRITLPEGIPGAGSD